MYNPVSNPSKKRGLPPCIKLLNNTNPIIKDGKLIFQNENRLFYFISTDSKSSNCIDNEASIKRSPSILTNLQISLPTYIIGVFINQIQLGEIIYNKDYAIHSDKSINAFIHNVLKNPPKINVNFIPSLALVFSNGNAILPPFTYNFNITPINYFILLVINRLECNPGLFFANNSFVTQDAINYILANLDIQIPIDYKKNK